MAKDRHTRLLSLFFILVGVGHVFCGPEYAETGTNYTFSPTVKGKIETILWKVNNDKLVEYESGELFWYRFKGRGNLDTESGKLTLMKMMKNDNAQYQSEIQVNKQLQYSVHDLTVMDAVPQPKVTCIKNKEGEVTSLECSLDSDVQAEFEWTGRDNMKYKGKTLQISNVTDRNTIYYCFAKNQVSEKSKEFNLKTCYPDDDNIPVATIAVLVCLIVIAAIGVGVGCYMKKRRSVKINGAGNSTGGEVDSEVGMPLMKTNESPLEKSNSTPKVDEKSLESSCKTENTENNQSSEKGQDSCKEKPESINKEDKEQEDGDDSTDEGPNGPCNSQLPKSAELHHEKNQDDVPTSLEETQVEGKINATESKGGDEDINHGKSEDQINSSINFENQDSGESGEGDEDINHGKSEDQINSSINFENQDSGESGEGDEDSGNINHGKSEDQINSSINFENQDSGESGEGLDQNPDTSVSPEFSTPGNNDDDGDS